MDLGLRESDPKMVVTTSATDNYFSEQALRAGIIANEMNRSELMMNSDPLRDAIHREYEKERIREEIIASEIRRRELEAEVRRELAFERELAIRRAGDGFTPLTSIPSMWSEPRFGMLDRPLGFGFGMNERMPFVGRAEGGSYERLPFQRNHVAPKVAEINKAEAGKVMHLAKPITSNLAGTKRKPTPTEGADVSKKLSAKKQPQEWTCSLCDVTATCEDGLNQHLQGKKHKAKEFKVVREAKKIKATQKKEKKIEVQGKKNATPGSKKELFPFWCEDCQIGCHSPIVLNNHRNGKRHKAQEEKLKQAGGSSSSTTKLNAIQRKAEDAPEEPNEEANYNIGKEVENEEELTETMGSNVDDVAEEEQEGLKLIQLMVKR